LFGKEGVVRSIVSFAPANQPRLTILFQNLIAGTRLRSMPAFSLGATFGKGWKVEGKNE
jgi:hypothetical protein